MSNVFLPFAESTAHQFDYDIDFFSVNPDEYDQDFPPLTTDKSPLSEDWEQVSYDDETFSCNSAIWVGTRSFAEIATDAGVQHEPVAFKNCSSPFRYHKILPNTPNCHKNQNQDESFDLWYHSKLPGCQKRVNKKNVARRKKKTYQIVYRRITYPFIDEWRNDIYPRGQLIPKARQYLSDTRSVEEAMQLRSGLYPRIRGIYSLKEEGGGTREISVDDKYGIQLWKRQRFESLCKNPRFKQIIMARCEIIADCRPLVRTQVLKRCYMGNDYYYGVLCYMGYNFFFSRYIINLSEELSALEEAYRRAKVQKLRAIAKALPSTKDKSLFNKMSRMQYAQLVFMQK